MSSIIAGHDKICAKIAESLGIKHCRWLQIDMHINEIVTVKAEFYPEIDGIKQLDTIFKQYELIEKSKEYGMDGDKVSAPNTFVNERDIKRNIE